MPTPPDIYQLATLLILLFAATITDLKYNTIPNYFTYPGILLGVFLPFIIANSPSIQTCFLGAFVGGAILLPLYFKDKLAAGDVKLMAMCGAFIGYPLIFITILLSFIFGGGYTLVTLIFYKIFHPTKPTPKHIPFAPSITCGTIMTLTDPVFIHPLKILLGI